MQLLTAIVFNKYMGFLPPDSQQARMFGILITPIGIYAAQSGNWAGGNTPFLIGALGRGYTICPPRTANGPSNTDAAGRPISPALYRSANRVNQGGYAAGNCAAPRLIQQAILDHQAQSVRINPARWSMSEVMYKLNPSEVPAPGRQDWIHGLTAFSCATCERLVPILLCDDVGWGEDNPLGFMRHL
jgi:hypothetical protein